MASFSELFGQTFNAEEAAKSTYEVLPAGWYKVQVDNIVDKATRNGGTMLEATFTVLDEGFDGRKVFARFNVRNSNAKAVEIGMRELGNLCVACGFPGAADTDELIGAFCEAQVVVSKDDVYGDRNDIKKYRPINGSAPAKPLPAAQPVTTQPATPAKKSSNTFPWRKS